jgi:nucleolar protein 6
MSTKLTKKQKKAAAFRGKKGGGGREETQDVPIIDDPEADDGFGQEAVESLKADAAKPTGASAAVRNKKRKREDDTVENNELPIKKVKLHVANEGGSPKPKDKKQTAAPRYILFVGACFSIGTKIVLIGPRKFELQDHDRGNRPALFRLR